MTPEPGVDRVQIDVGSLMRRSVATLYSHLVTRPTGRAVRLAIETQLSEAGTTSCSLIDLSEVTILDFSCADEVVAKLLARYLDEDRPRDAFFVFRGLGEHHRHPIEEVLERHALAAVAERAGSYELIGVHTEGEKDAWDVVEARGVVRATEVDRAFPGARRDHLSRLVRRRLVYEAGGDVVALSRLVADLT